jgi:chromosome segregation ATPase
MYAVHLNRKFTRRMESILETEQYAQITRSIEKYNKNESRIKSLESSIRFTEDRIKYELEELANHDESEPIYQEILEEIKGLENKIEERKEEIGRLKSENESLKVNFKKKKYIYEHYHEYKTDELLEIVDNM